ncbi:MAG: hypothetical protein KGO92_00555 [Bacteroidota bacterium]|nr:hypothetical protein [Bacteroidota bacterium]
MTNLKDILQQDDELHAEELLRYLQGNASAEERFSIENQMADSTFLSEAVEGLQGYHNPDLVKKQVEQLNRQLQKQTAKRRIRKYQRKLKDQNWLIIAILTILLLCVTGFLLIHFYAVKH